MAKRGPETDKHKKPAKPKKARGPNGRPKKYTDVEVMQARIDAYFAECDEKEDPYTITGLAVALDMDRDSLLNYAKEEKFFGAIKNAKMKCHAYAEKRLFSGGQAAGVIFNLKNNYGWKDKLDVEAFGKEGGPIHAVVEFITAEIPDE